MSTPSFIPSRPAPSPPYSTHTPRLPPNHPFANYYTPTQSNASVETFQTFAQPKHRSLPISPSSSASSSDYSSYSYASRSRSNSRGPTSILSQPLAPRPVMYRTYTGYTTSPTHHNYEEIPLALPAELSIFDHKPRQTMVSDLETIFGRKFRSFGFGRRNKETQQEKAAAKEQRQRRVLRKERERSWEEDFVWREVKSRDSSDEKSVYRGQWV